MIHSFDQNPIPPLAQVGGKGHSLIRLTQAGINVPPGFILSVAFFAPWLSHLQTTTEWTAVQTALQNNEPLSPSTNALKAACTQLTFSAEQEEQVAATIAQLPPDILFAVRSSSPEEDLAGASFAGGYETTLGVTKENMSAAIRDSFASTFDERVFVYKQQQSFATDNPRIAVIVQQQIAAETAGVGFSLNPLNNDYDEAVIDANWGLGESVVAGMVSPDHFVIDKVTKQIVEKQLGTKETAVYLNSNGGIEEREPNSSQLCLNDEQLVAITQILIQIEELYQHPVDIEWAYAENKLYLLQARPITTYVPLPPAMLTAPGERRTLYLDASLTEGLTSNAPISPLTIDWISGAFGTFMSPFVGPMNLQLDSNPHESIIFSAGARLYLNLSQFLTLADPKQIAAEARSGDALMADVLENVDRPKYRAQKKVDALRWWRLLSWIFTAFRHSTQWVGRLIRAVRNPSQFYEEVYQPQITKTIRQLKQPPADDLSIEAFMADYNEQLMVVIRDAVFPTLIPYAYHVSRIQKLFAKDSKEIRALADKLNLGAVGNEAVDLGVQLYRMSQLLTAEDFNDLDQLADRLKQGELPSTFHDAWTQFIDQYGFRGPAEMDLATPRYGDDPQLALEQISYMVNSTFDPGATLQKHVVDRQQAYEQLLTMVSGRKKRKLITSYEMIQQMAGTRDTPKYLLVLYGGAFRQRMLQEGEKLVEQGRLDAPSHIFDLTLAEIQQGEADPTFDLRQARMVRLPFYEKLHQQVKAFPHLIDSRGRIGQAKQQSDDPQIKVGLGISRGVARGRVKVLHTPREKPIEKGDVLVAYTTDPGWTPLFVNAEAIILEVGGMLQHGGVVAREYGKPCVAGIQAITTSLQDGQLVEVDGTTGIIRLLQDE